MEQLCLATREGLICRKPIHRGRHTYRPRPAPSVQSSWEEIDHFLIFSGSKTYTIRRGSPCKVIGFGRRTGNYPDGAPQEGWTVSKIEQNIHNPQDINVTVNKRGEHTRTVKSVRIVYVRPKRGDR